MEHGFQIQPSAYYDGKSVCELLNVKRSSLDKERQRGDLRAVRRAGQFLYRGQWLLDWLSDTPTDQSEVSPNG